MLDLQNYLSCEMTHKASSLSQLLCIFLSLGFGFLTKLLVIQLGFGPHHNCMCLKLCISMPEGRVRPEMMVVVENKRLFVAPRSCIIKLGTCSVAHDCVLVHPTCLVCSTGSKHWTWTRAYSQCSNTTHRRLRRFYPASTLTIDCVMITNRHLLRWLIRPPRCITSIEPCRPGISRACST